MNFRVRTLQLVIASALAACPDEQVHTRIAKVAEPPAAEAAQPLPSGHPTIAQPSAEPPKAPPPGMAGNVPPPPRPTGASQLTWSLPTGWTQTLTGGIRYATLKAPTAGTLEISVVVLGGPAGGEAANVNRWRSQIGLPPLAEGALDTARKIHPTKVGPVAVYDFTSEGTVKTRLVAGLAQSDGNTWFFKMTGDATAVEKALPDFTHLVDSLQPGAK